MINILILHKSKRDVALLSSSICTCIDDSVNITVTANIDEGFSLIAAQQTVFDLFILGVKLGNRSGYTVEKAIRQHRSYAQTPILFITEESYNLVGFPYLATYQAYKKSNYLSLPLDKLDIQGKIGLYLDSIAAKQHQNDLNNRCLDLKGVGGIRKIPLRFILYLEIQNKTCNIHTDEGQYQIKRTSLSKILDEINSDTILRCHRFFAVNKNNIDFIERRDSRIWQIHFIDSNLTCPASKSYLGNMLPCI